MQRRPGVIVTDIGYRYAELVSEYMRHSIGAKSSLAWSHAATGKRLCLVRSDTSQCYDIANLARAHFLAATHQGFISGV